MFHEDYFCINKENNSFTLRSWWYFLAVYFIRMIQALGTLKLFKDIDEDNIIEGFEFSQYSSLEEADDKGIFYTKINDNTQEEFINKMMHEVMNSNSCKPF